MALAMADTYQRIEESTLKLKEECSVFLENRCQENRVSGCIILLLFFLVTFSIGTDWEFSYFDRTWRPQNYIRRSFFETPHRIGCRISWIRCNQKNSSRKCERFLCSSLRLPNCDSQTSKIRMKSFSQKMNFFLSFHGGKKRGNMNDWIQILLSPYNTE